MAACAESSLPYLQQANADINVLDINLTADSTRDAGTLVGAEGSYMIA